MLLVFINFCLRVNGVEGWWGQKKKILQGKLRLKEIKC